MDLYLNNLGNSPTTSLSPTTQFTPPAHDRGDFSVSRAFSGQKFKKSKIKFLIILDDDIVFVFA